MKKFKEYITKHSTGVISWATVPVAFLTTDVHWKAIVVYIFLNLALMGVVALAGEE